MAIDFPNSPQLNEEFVSGTRKWIWDGSVWNGVSQSILPDISGNAGTFLSTDGLEPSWQGVDYGNLFNIPSSFSPSAHNHIVSDVTGLQSSLNEKANLSGATFTGAITSPIIARAINRADISIRTEGGFYEHGSPTTENGWPLTGGWYHLLSSTHSNLSNYFSMQFAGAFDNSNSIFYRATGNNGLAQWHRILHTGNASPISNRSTNYTIVSGDAYSTIVSTGNAITVTIANVLAVGQRIDFVQDGTGQITFSPGSGVTLQSKDNNRKTAARYVAASIICVGAGQYRLIGDLVA